MRLTLALLLALLSPIATAQETTDTADPPTQGEEAAEAAERTDSHPEPVIDIRTPDTSEPETFVFIVGVEDIYQKPEVPTVPGTVEDCRALEAYFENTVGLPDDHVKAVCGSEATRTRHFSMLNDLIGNEDLNAGDVVLYIAITPGWLTPPNETYPDGEPVYLMYDASQGGAHSDGRPQNSNVAEIVPSLIQKAYGPMDVTTVMLIDAVHEGEYASQPMIGPDAKDYETMAGDTLLVISATGDGNPSKPGLFADTIMACWGSPADSNGTGWISTEEFSACMTGGSRQAGQTIGMRGNWQQPMRLGRWLPEDQLPTDKRSKSERKPVLRYAGLAVGAVGIGAGLAVHSSAGPLYHDLADDPTSTYANKQEWMTARDQYSTMYWTRTGLYTLGAVGFAISGTTFVVGPNRVTLAGRF